MPTLDLLKRSELARILTNAEMDGNLTAIETAFNNMLAGTGGYDVGNAWKLGGVLASLFWNSNNCPKLFNPSGWQKLASGMILQWGNSVVANTGTAITFPLVFPVGVFAVIATANDTGLYFASASAIGLGGCSLKQSYVGSLSVFWVALGQ